MSLHRAGALATPVVLTYNESPNIARSLTSLAWADEVVVVDSGSTDDTERIARGFRNVRWLVRPFDTHRAQWEFAIRAAGDRTPYVLALDADYRVPEAFPLEIAGPFAAAGAGGGIAGFDYRINGQTLSGSMYPAKLAIFRPDRVVVAQPGHSQELTVDGPTYRFKTRLIHEDRKSTSRFVTSQLAYSRLEARRLAAAGADRWQDRVRRTGLMPLIAGPIAYLRAGGPLKGTASLRYAYERTLFECLLALRILGPDDAETQDASDSTGTPAQ